MCIHRFTIFFAQSCWTLCDHIDYIYSPWNSPGQNTRVGSLSLLQGIFPTQGSNPGLPHCRQILDQLSHQGNPRILDWVAYPFYKGSSWTRNQTRVSCIAGRFFTSWAPRESQHVKYTCWRLVYFSLSPDTWWFMKSLSSFTSFPV